MMLCGFPTRDPRIKPLVESYSQGKMRDFGGNQFPLTIISAIMIALNSCWDHGYEQAAGVDMAHMGFDADAIAAADIWSAMQQD